MSETVETDPTPKTKRRRLRLWPRSRRGQVITTLAIVVVLAGAATGTWFVLSQPKETAAAATTQTLTISPTTLKTTVSASGTLAPEREADLSFDTSSTVKSVKVKVGDTVEEGDTLATIDDSSLQIAYDSAKADLTAAEETLTDLEDDDDSTDAAIKAAEASVQVKKNAVTAAKVNLKAATMTAPFDALVAEVNIEKGDSTGSSSSSAGGSTGGDTSAMGATSSSSSSTSSSAIVLISKDAYTVSTTVSSSDIASVKTGLQAELTVDGSSDTLYGTVSSVAVTASSSSSGTASFPVTITLTGKQEGLYSGSSVTADIIVSQLTDVIAVPASAITTTDGKSTVNKLVDGVATATEVTTGDTVDSTVVITDGLAEGDQIEVTMTTPGGGGSGTQSGNSGFPTDGSIPDMSQMGGGQMPDFSQTGGQQGGMGGGPNQ